MLHDAQVTDGIKTVNGSKPNVLRSIGYSVERLHTGLVSFWLISIEQGRPHHSSGFCHVLASIVLVARGCGSISSGGEQI